MSVQDTQGPQLRYRRLNHHFQACAELPESKRREYVATVSATDPDLGKELNSLLSHHPPTPDPQPAAASKSSSQDGTKTRWRKSRLPVSALILAGGVVVTLVIFLSQSWAIERLEDHLRDSAVQMLRQSVKMRSDGLRVWSDRQKEQARRQLDDPALMAQVRLLLAEAEQPNELKARLKAHPAFAEIQKILSRTPTEIGGLGFVIVSPSGIGLCADPDSIVGLPVGPAGAAYVRRMNLGEWIVSRPYPDRQFTPGLAPDLQRPVMFVGGPIRAANGQIIALGGFRFAPDRFYEHLRPSSSELVAFDEKCVLLNDLSDPEFFRSAGLLPPEAGNSTVFRLQLRDPGLSLPVNDRVKSPPTEWPPTLMCRSAVQGTEGSDALGHRDLRGRTVLAAWTWLPDWEMGLGAQLPLDGVLSPSRPIRSAFMGLLALPALVTVGLLGTLRFVRRKRGLDTVFGSYRLEKPIGKGGMAEVYLARHAFLNRPAAVKILSEAHPSADAVLRFEREARLASRLGHPNTIHIHDYGETPDGRLFYAMEYVEGLTLAQLLAVDGPVPVARAAYFLAQIAGSLEEANEIGLLHRDLKPSNVMVSIKGGMGDVIKVLDFGIACLVSGTTEDVTKSQNLVGTPAFIAPERIRDPRTLDTRSDIYSFGAVAFHLLTGRNVFEGSSPTELIYQVMTSPRPSPSKLRGDELPAELEKLVLDCLSADPEARPRSFQIIGEILGRMHFPDPWNQEKARAWWAANRGRIAGFVRATT